MRVLCVSLFMSLCLQVWAQEDTLPARNRAATRLVFKELPATVEFGSLLTLTAELTTAENPRQPIEGKVIRFSVFGQEVGSPTTGPDGRASMQFLVQTVNPLKIQARFRGGPRYQGDETRLRNVDVTPIPVAMDVTCAQLRFETRAGKRVIVYAPFIRATNANTGVPLPGVELIADLENFASHTRCAGAAYRSEIMTDGCGHIQPAYAVTGCTGTYAHLDVKIKEEQTQFVRANPAEEIEVLLASCRCDLGGSCPQMYRTIQSCSEIVPDDDGN